LAKLDFSLANKLKLWVNGSKTHKAQLFDCQVIVLYINKWNSQKT